MNDNRPKILPCGTPDTTLTSYSDNRPQLRAVDDFIGTISVYTTQNLQSPRSRAYREFPDG